MPKLLRDHAHVTFILLSKESESYKSFVRVPLKVWYRIQACSTKRNTEKDSEGSSLYLKSFETTPTSQIQGFQWRAS